MAKWKDLPHKVVTQIVDCLKSHTRKKQWMFTNKALYEAYLAFQYKTQFVDSQNTSDNPVDATLNSPLLSGRYIKTLSLKNFTPTGDLDRIVQATEPLYRMMKRCPNFRKVSLRTSEEIAAKDWFYFSKVLLNNTSWKLQDLSLPDNCDSLCLQIYDSCAYHLRNSLESLSLKNRMISSKYLQPLV